MFKTESSGGAETLIGPSVHVEGDFKSQGNIQIEGVVTGSIQTSGVLTVGAEARINANIQAGSARVAGFVKGNLVVTDRLELASSARIDGDIVASVLVISEGAELNGRCQMGSSPAPVNQKTAAKKTATE